MAEIGYLDLDLAIERAGAGYRVDLNSPAGQSTTDLQLPFSDLELENFLLKIGQTRRVVRRIDAPETEAAKAFGARLFDAVFAGEARGCLRSSLDAAGQHGQGLRIRLRLAGAPELVGLPWEYLYHSALNRFFALSVETPIVRYLELPERIRPLAIAAPLRLLAIIASPRDQAPLDVEREWQRLRAALGALEQRGIVQIERLEQPSLAELQRQLRRGEYHILHFIGHGGFDERSQDGVLLLEDSAGLSYRISGQDLGTVLHDHRTLRLAVLNSCDGARGSRTDPFGGTAQSLVQQGLPAVIAMQFEVSDEAAIILAHEFYGAIADGYPVDAALAEARKALFAAHSGVEWGTPVLYLRAQDARIFDLTTPALVRSQTLVPPLDVPDAAGERFLDAALPEQVVVDQAIELVALIRRPDSAGLRALLEVAADEFEARPEDVRSRAFEIEFPRDSAGRAAPLELALAIETTDFQTSTPQQRIRLDPLKDSEPVVFLLTPLHSGELRLVVHVYVEQDLLLASGFLKVSGVSQLAEGLRPLRRLISLSLGSFGLGRAPMSPPQIGTQASPQPAAIPPPNRQLPQPYIPESPQPLPARAATPRWRTLAPFLSVLVLLISLGVTLRIFERSNTASAPNPTTAAGTVLTSQPASPTTAAPTPAATYAAWAGITAPLATITTTTQLNTVAVSPDGARIAAGGLDNVIRIWELATQTLVRELVPSLQRTDTVTKLAFSPDGMLLASAGAGTSVQLWDVATGRLARQLGGPDGHTDTVLTLAFAPDGALLASGSLDQTIKIWRVADGALLRTLRGHTAAVYGLAFSPDSRLLASGGFDNANEARDSQARLWLVNDGTLRRSFAGATQGIMSVAFSPDGATVAAGSWDNTAYLWHVADGTALGRLEGNSVNTIYDLTFSPDSSVVAVGSGDGALRLFATADTHQICVLAPRDPQGNQYWITSVAFTPDGRRVITSSYDMTIRIWGFAS